MIYPKSWTETKAPGLSGCVEYISSKFWGHNSQILKKSQNVSSVPFVSDHHIVICQNHIPGVLVFINHTINFYSFMKRNILVIPYFCVTCWGNGKVCLQSSIDYHLSSISLQLKHIQPPISFILKPTVVLVLVIVVNCFNFPTRINKVKSYKTASNYFW